MCLPRATLQLQLKGEDGVIQQSCQTVVKLKAAPQRRNGEVVQCRSCGDCYTRWMEFSFVEHVSAFKSASVVLQKLGFRRRVNCERVFGDLLCEW
jgi:hypothetical protein